MNVRTHVGAALLLLLPIALSARAAVPHDGEWPPLPDPQWDFGSLQVIGNPGPGSHLYLDQIEFAIPNQQPQKYADWITHRHAKPMTGCSEGFGGFYTDFSIGDVDNDGLEDDIVITQSGEAVFAAEMEINWTTMTGSLNPLWLWLSPYAETNVEQTTPEGDTLVDHAGMYSCKALGRSNPLIWNVDAEDQADSTNEVVFVGLDANDQEQIFVLRTDPSEPDGVALVAQTTGNDTLQVERRLAVAKVRNTAFPRDIVVSQHHDGKLFLWRVEGTELVHEYSANSFDTNSPLLAKTHQFNWTDIDGDGFDEFFANGLLDFVDADESGNPVPKNGVYGVAVWQIMKPNAPNDSGHCDKILVADWDPERAGLEVYAITELGKTPHWTEAQTGIVHDDPLDTLWDADCGTLLDQWDEAPAEDGQTLHAANWTTTYKGIEAILSPKDLDGGGSSQVIPPGQNQMDGSYVTVVRTTTEPNEEAFQLLAIDGSIYAGPIWYDAANTVKLRAGGPWRRMWPIDWDGDYATDEIFNHPINEGPVTLYRLGEKGDWGAGPLPPGLPTETQVKSPVPPIMDGDDPGCPSPFGAWYFYAQGDCGEHRSDWAWNNGGPGRGTHYFEKLKEDFPNSGRWGAIVAHPYDLLGSPDQREEIVAISNKVEPRMHVYYNSDTLPPGAFARPSPRGSLAYRAFRQTQLIPPFSFQEQAVALEAFRVRQSGGTVARRVIGIEPGETVQLEAFLEYSDGTVDPAPAGVTWLQDPASTGYFTLSAGGLVTEVGGETASGRFSAELTIEGEVRQSEPFYVFASASDDPAILRAGYRESWLVDDAAQDDRPLVVEAYVAQKDGLVPTVLGLEVDGTVWFGLELRDNGEGADETAHDGVYSARVQTPYGITLGDNLRALRAMMPPLQQNLYPPYDIQGVANSDPWPYYVHQTGGQAPWPATNCPTPLSTEAVAYEGPRVLSLGYRGWRVPGQLLLEAVVEPSPLHPGAPMYVYAHVVGAGYMPMTEEAPGIYPLQLETAGAPPGFYVHHFAAAVIDEGTTYVGDFGQRLRLHQVPDWDTDEPADLDPGCTELELSGW